MYFQHEIVYGLYHRLIQPEHIQNILLFSWLGAVILISVFKKNAF